VVITVTTDADKIYCTAPWNGLTIRENGDVRTCCVGNKVLGNINNSDIKEIQQSDKLLEIQNNFVNNNIDKENCQLCIDEENNSLPSLRHYYNRYYKDTNNNKLKLKVIDVRWSNNCNLQCMYCSPMFSSTWESALDSKTKLPINQAHHDNVANWIVDNAGDLREIMLVGGEPLLMKQNYKILKSIPLETKVTILTNLSYNIQDLPCLDSLLAKDPNSVIWNISLENTHRQFEYVRNKASWDIVEGNLLFLTENFPENVSINFVYSMFSAFDIKNTFINLINIGIKKFNLMAINHHPTMNLLNMPTQIKIKALEDLEAATEIHKNSICAEDLDFYPIFGLNNIRQALLLPSKNLTTKYEFYKKIEWYDQWHDQKFKDLWPHVTELVNLHLY
jgi:MoaA/NifB/PqqE/SkfB family radical SAM enzyme